MNAYLEMHGMRLKRMAALARRLLNGTTRILDVGPHFLTMELQDLGLPVDTLGLWIEGDAGTPKLGPGCHHYEMNLNFLGSYSAPWKGPKYGLAVASNIVEHLCISPHHWMGLFASVLDRDGKLLVVTDNGVSLKRRLRMLAGRQPYMPLHRVPLNGDFGHVREFTSAEISAAGRECGLELVDHWIQADFDYRERWGHLYNSVQRLLPQSFRDNMYFIWTRQN
jgi:hypothetical protein